MKYNFDEIIDRKNKGFIKWEKYKDTDILPMWVADMEFKSPKSIIERLKRKANEGLFGYSLPPKEAYQAVMDYEKREHNWNVEKDWIIFVPGLVSSLYAIFRIFTDTSQKIVTFFPVYPPFIKAPKNVNRELKSIFLHRSNSEYIFNFDEIENAIDENDKMLLFCNPHNPTGKVFSKKELQKLEQIAKENNMIVVSDEIHCDLILDKDKKHIPFATISEYAKQNSITMHAPSKTYNIAGLNAAVLIIPNEKIREKFFYEVEESIPLVNVLGYQGLISAYNECNPWRKNLLEYLRKNRDIVFNFINSTQHLSMKKPQATYLAWIDISKLKLENPIKYFEKFGIGLSDGAEFGQKGFIRLNFGCPKKMLYQGLERIDKAIKSV